MGLSFLQSVQGKEKPGSFLCGGVGEATLASGDMGLGLVRKSGSGCLWSSVCLSFTSSGPSGAWSSLLPIEKNPSCLLMGAGIEMD